MAKPEKKPYRLLAGTHRVPNPSFDAEHGDPEESHVIAQKGDVVHLTDEQFKSFKDKFAPISTDSTDVRDADAAQLEAAKEAAAKSKTNIDPNKPIAPQVATTANKPGGGNSAPTPPAS